MGSIGIPETSFQTTVRRVITQEKVECFLFC